MPTFAHLRWVSEPQLKKRSDSIPKSELTSAHNLRMNLINDALVIQLCADTSPLIASIAITFDVWLVGGPQDMAAVALGEVGNTF